MGANALTLTFNFNVFTGPVASTAIFRTLGSFIGLVSLLGAIALTIVRSIYESDDRNWKPILVVLIVWLAFLLLAPVPLPNQAWLYICGLLLALVTTSSIVLTLITSGPLLIRVLGGVALTATVVSVSYLGLLSFAPSSRFAIEQSLKRDDLRTPYSIVQVLEATSQSIAIEDGANGFQQVPRNCGRADAICVADVGVHDVTEISRRLGLEGVDWRAGVNANFAAPPGVDLYQMQYSQLNIILAQARGKRVMTIFNLSKLTDEQEKRTNFALPPP